MNKLANARNDETFVKNKASHFMGDHNAAVQKAIAFAALA